MAIETTILDEDSSQAVVESQVKFMESIRKTVREAGGKSFEAVELDEASGEVRSAIDEA